MAVGAIEILSIGYRQRQSAYTSLAREELGMADASSVDVLGEFTLQLVLSYYIGKTHNCIKIVKQCSFGVWLDFGLLTYAQVCCAPSICDQPQNSYC